jgi:transposase
MLSEYECKKFNTIEKLEKGGMTRKEASRELDISLRQIDRLRKVYLEKGKDGFIHKNRGKKSNKKISNEIIEEIEQLYLDEYFDFNIEAFYEEIISKEKYKDKYDISYSTLHQKFLNDDIISPIAHKGTVILYNEKMKSATENNDNVLSKEKKELIESRIIAWEKARPRKSSNLYSFGQEVQMDACEKMWFGNIVTYLHLAVDKATKKVLFGWFEYEEITRAYFILIYNMIINYGIPVRIKTDNRNSFSNNKNQVNTTQIGGICKFLNIELITTSEPTKKPNVERMNKTFKDRLIAELRHEGITEIDKANKYLNEVFIPKMNKKFSYKIDEKTSKMRTNHYSYEELDLIISEKYTRIIDNASSLKYAGKYYIPIDSKTGEIVNYKRGTECTLIITYNSEYWCKIESNYYQLLELESRKSTMKKEEENKPNEKKKYIPPKDHPWRKNMMLRKSNWDSAPNPEV